MKKTIYVIVIFMLVIPYLCVSQDSLVISNRSFVDKVNYIEVPQRLRDGLYPKVISMPDSSYLFILNELQVDDWLRKDELVQILNDKIENLLSIDLTNTKLASNQDIMIGLQTKSSIDLDKILNNTTNTYVNIASFLDSSNGEYKELKQKYQILGERNEVCVDAVKYYKHSSAVWKGVSIVSMVALFTKLANVW